MDILANQIQKLRIIWSFFIILYNMIIFYRLKLSTIRNVVIIILACFTALPNYAQIKELEFHNLTTELGLSDANTFCVYQDFEDFIWIGTADGLNKYDGSNFHVYRHKKNDPLSLRSSNIICIFEDRSKNLWIGTNKGFNLYNRDMDCFEQIPFKEENVELQNGYVYGMHEDNDGNLWLASNSGAYIYEKENKEIKKQFTSYFGKEYQIHCGFIGSDKKGGIWATFMDGEKGGLFRYERKKNKIKRYHKNGKKNKIKHNGITACLISENNIWLGYPHLGIDVLDIESEVIRSYSANVTNADSLSNNRILSISKDSKGNIYIGTDNGLNIFDLEKQNFTRHYSSTSKSSVLSNIIQGIYLGRNDDLWLACRGGGVSMYDKRLRKFSAYNHLPGILNSLSHNSVIAFTEDNNGKMWIATDGGGINYFDPQTKMFKHFKNELGNPNSLTKDKVLAIQADNDDGLWAGMWEGGLCYFKIDGDHLVLERKYPFVGEGHTSSGSVFNIHKTQSGDIWVGTFSNGPYKLNTKTDKFEHFPFVTSIGKYYQYQSVMDILCDYEGNMWFATEDEGLIYYNTKTKKHIHYTYNENDTKGLPASTIFALLEDKEKRLWLGTGGGGLCIYNRKKNTFKTFTTEEGLPSNMIHGLLEDEHGNIWISTNRGLSKMSIHVKNEKIEVAFRNYDLVDGLQSLYFNPWAFFKSKSGSMYFGGINGFNMFNPTRIIDNTEKPKVIINDFLLFNKPVIAGKDGAPLYKSISQTNEITLNHKQSIFTFKFKALSFIHADKCEYAYKMQNFEENWNYVGNQQLATYTNLPAGEYVFKVKASNNDGVWNEDGASVELIILPPFWQTWWFVGLITLLVLSSFLSFYFVRIRIIKQQKLLLEKTVDKRTLQLREANEEMKQKKEEISSQKEELQKRNVELQIQQDEIKTKNTILEKKNIELSQQKEEIILQKTEIERITEEVKNANEMKIRFFTSMSHEFRTPLTLILGPLESMKEKFISDKETMVDISIIRKNSLRLLRLINEILDLRKLDTKNMKVSCVKSDIVLFINNICNAFNASARKKGVELVFWSEKPNYQTWFDPGKIEIIFYNLISNALRYTYSSGKISIITNVDENGNKLVFCVKDTGMGIDKARISKIFNRFYQAEQNSSMEYYGTGIGLSLTKEIVELLNGEINISSELGKGTCFRIKLPIINNIDDHELEKYVFYNNGSSQSQYKFSTQFIDENEDNTSVENEIDIEHAGGNKHIVLLVEDDAELRYYISSCLNKSYDIYQAENGKEGFEIAKEVQPSIIISDIMMPVMDGIEFCKIIKEDVETSHIPVILLTARTTFESQLESFETGADAFIPKPFNKRYLQTRVKALIESRIKLRNSFHDKLTLEPKEITVTSVDEVFISNAKKIVEDNIDNSEFGVPELVQSLGISRSLIYRKFKQLTNCSTSEFIKIMRLKRACQLLNSKQYRVSEICYMVGFNDPHSFSKIFKKHYGVSPSKYSE